jgi:hypothetical protein
MESFCIGRRSLTTVDLYEGLITLSELGALNVLRDRADIETGGWKTNAPALTTFCGGSLSVDQADRLLRSLDRKGYIKRWPTQKHEVYPYLVHGYYITDGMNKGKYLNAHKTTDWKSPVYEAEPPVQAEAHPQTHPQKDGQKLPHPQGHPQDAPQTHPQDIRTKEAFFADKYIRITNNNTGEGISKSIDRDGQDSNQPSKSFEEGQTHTPCVSASASVPATNIPVPAKDTPVPAKNRPDADELANVLLTALATPKRFNTPPTVLHWSELMAGLIEETELGVGELAEFITWAVRDNINEKNPKLSSAEFIPKAKDPCQTLLKHSMGSNPWLFVLWESQQKLAQKKEAKASATTTSQSDVPEFGKGGVSSFGTYMDKLRAAKHATYNYPTTHKENQ